MENIWEVIEYLAKSFQEHDIKYRFGGWIQLKRWLKILSILIVLFVFTGCYALEVKYNPDGSGQLTYIPAKDGQPLKINELKETIAEMNQKAGQEVVKFLSAERNQDHLEYTASFTKISYIFEDGELYFGALQEFMKEKPGKIKSVRDRKGELIGIAQIDPKLYVAFHNTGFLDRIRVQVPGKVLYVSEAAKIINGRTVEITKDFGFVIFRMDNYLFWILLFILLVVILMKILYRVSRKKRVKKETLG
jgi:hypothetical protein